MDDRRRSPLRFLAPVALLVFAVVFLAILMGSGGSDDGDTTSGTAEEQRQRDLGKSKKKQQQRKREGKLPQKTYTVQSGDTLGSIADKTGIPVEKLQELNPELDPQQLVSGQKVKLRE
jgi:LysM repeat protein